ncbi:hypothetical protein QQG09_09130 [Melissococcus plutonius]|uniref:hypothetical protein n=1 Tax=Melissococcus plutonius TaxID=33970 RepID=UPI0021E61EDC|nr:hypothetical protein [Melissococcus plutonius]MCV2499678.1 hypothetical protein [Melissococcus plutonius]MCV2501982.1 hypothetical protein [Melissococcus plutonius]MCV2508288.1 hypothetical protein [Melissococcus plutonius]MCV2528118.1 hypothetical protein [Melissococcus plutonius]
MATDKRQFTMRMQQINFDKIKYISDQEKRSMAAEIELLIEKKISDYENSFGTIEVSPQSDNN